MWKKIIVLLLGIMGIGVVLYTADYQLFATSSNMYASGNEITGRIHKNPSNLTVQNAGFQKGDKILMGTKVSGTDTTNPNVYHNEPIAWQLLQEKTYNDYVSDTCIASLTTRCANEKQLHGWLSMSTKAIDKKSTGLVKADYVYGSYLVNNISLFAPYAKSSLYQDIEQLNANFLTEDRKLIVNRNLNFAHNAFFNTYTSTTPGYKFPADSIKFAVFSIPQNSRQLRQGAFLLSFHEVWDHYSSKPTTDPLVQRVNNPNPDTAFYENYWSSDFYHDGYEWVYTSMHFGPNGTWGATYGGFKESNVAINNTKRLLRPAIWLNLDDAVFAVSKGNSTGMGKINVPKLPDTYTSMIDATASYNDMKIRLEDTSLSNTTQLQDVTDADGNSIQEILEGKKVYIKANAFAGSDSDGVNTVSVLVFDEQNNFVFYQPLEPAKGEGIYAFDTAGIPEGKYSIGIVNEVYNDSSTAPTMSSAITDVIPLEIVPPLSDLTFTAETSLEYGKNVSKNDKVGVINSQNGVGIPEYTLLADPSYPGDAALFELDADGKTVNLKENALDAGTYYFKIQAQDANGDPSTPLEIQASITVAKTDPDLKFDTTIAVNKHIGDPIFTELFTHENTDTADPDFLLTYSSSMTTIATVDTPTSNEDKDVQITLGTQVGMTVIQVNIAETKNFKSASSNLTVNVFPQVQTVWNQTNRPQADKTNGNEKVGDISVTGGSGNASFAISISNVVDNLDKDFFHIDPTNGEVTLNKPIEVNDIIFKTYNATENAYEMKVMVDITIGGSVTTKPLTIYINGAERANLDFKNKDKITQEITETYDADKQFQLSLTQNITGTEYRISTNPSHVSPTDVILVTTNGNADILNANEVSVEGSTIHPVYVEAVVPASNGYKEMIVEAPVRIKRKEQTLTFSQNPINTSADIQSLNVSVSGHMDTQPLIFTSDNNMIDVNADPSDSDQVIIKPNGTVANGIRISAQAQGDRNYKDRKDDAILNIAQVGTQLFSAVFPNMTYGDAEPFKVSIIPTGDGTETYTYEVKDTNVLEIDDIGNINIHHAGTTNVKITKISSGGVIGPYTFNVTVKPKPVTITIDDEEKYVGMTMPTFHANIPTLVGSDTLPQPDFTCEKADGTTVNAQTEPGTYNISGNYTNSNPDYKITFMKGELTVKQDTASTAWYHLEDADGNTTKSSVWHKNPIDIVLNSNSEASAGIYDEISGDLTFNNPNKTRFTVSQEGEILQNIYFRINPTGSGSNKGAISSPIQETIRIDYTEPVIQSISAKDNGNSKVRQFLNAVTFGNFFKPGTVVTIQAEDIVPKVGMKTSGIANISYRMQELNEMGDVLGQEVSDIVQEQRVDISLQKPGKYKVCATASDHAGNISKEKCEEFVINKINEDIDKDGKPDFNDPDGNGCADFNIVYKDEDGNWVTLNEDKDRDGIPELNIDTDGDGEPDINVDTDNDGKPDLNLVILTEEDWKPAQCVTQHGEQYASIVNIKPQINIDKDITDPSSKSFHIPDINIDNKGDFKPHINISQNGETPQINIVKIHTWTPEKDFMHGGFTYDTMVIDEKKEVLLNIDTDGDGRPDVNVDLNGDGKPDINVDTDGNWIPDINIDSTGDGEPDVNVDTTKDGKADTNVIEIKEWKPDKNVDGKLPYDTMEVQGSNILEDQGVQVERPNGTFLPNYAIKVNDVTKTSDDELKQQILYGQEDAQIKTIYDVALLKDGVITQPDGRMKVRIPVDKDIQNPRLVIEQKDGSFLTMAAIEEDGYYIFETEYLGKVSIIGDSDVNITEPEPEEPKKPTTSVGGGNIKEPSVKGTYTKNIGGADTGDVHNTTMFLMVMLSSLGFIIFLYRRNQKNDYS